MPRAMTLTQLRVLDAVAAEGSLQAAAARLGRTHPTLHTAIANIEREIGFTLFDRSGYRLTLTPAGAAFLARAQRVLVEVDGLLVYADHVAAGDEIELTVVIGDLTPLPPMLELLKDFFAGHPQTRLNLRFETLSAPWELLENGRADLILHHVEQGDTRFETLPLRRVKLIPVVAPGFLTFPAQAATVERMRDFTQCVIRDSAVMPADREYFMIDGARTCTVTDQIMKREVILQGLGWGHMPDYLVAEDIRQGRLQSIANSVFRGGSVDIVAARKAGNTPGPIAAALWSAMARPPSQLFAQVDTPA
ncbi:LysR family transcriptional regulator [Nitrospirillum amazonense]|uniref:LysR family transcriptional regulator n=1 Tax=Nitrospirillum amazonense TaxID=28077 RepID=UPI00241256AD|nr:LysR family transcriptional regulator [Nitrospirillum amazonense]MDG3443492.1 LysR family transcriptional regulator [Nitrospirillum amazonense]